jgi:hypothetical protein
MHIVHTFVGRLRGVIVLIGAGMLLGLSMSALGQPDTPTAVSDASRMWLAVVSEAKSLALPTRFLQQIPPRFVTFEFEDLHAFAAEYHPKDHRMVLNRSLSLNAAGGTLRPLARLTHKELETLYHELFHAYMDFLEQESAPPEGHASLMAFAREQQRCRYQQVLITPVLQKKELKEERFLSEAESWEALNETWAVFVGWAVWTQMELGKKGTKEVQPGNKPRYISAWVKRLELAERDAVLKGYYEPEDPNEKLVTRKRFLAPEFRLSAPELTVLMRDVLGSSAELIGQASLVLIHSSVNTNAQRTCPAPVSR